MSKTRTQRPKNSRATRQGRRADTLNTAILTGPHNFEHMSTTSGRRTPATFRRGTPQTRPSHVPCPRGPVAYPLRKPQRQDDGIAARHVSREVRQREMAVTVRGSESVAQQVSDMRLPSNRKGHRAERGR